VGRVMFGNSKFYLFFDIYISLINIFVNEINKRFKIDDILIELETKSYYFHAFIVLEFMRVDRSFLKTKNTNGFNQNSSN
jgi:hypothetical protein